MELTKAQSHAQGPRDNSIYRSAHCSCQDIYFQSKVLSHANGYFSVCTLLNLHPTLAYDCEDVEKLS
jgi:hypothetical protein